MAEDLASLDPDVLLAELRGREAGKADSPSVARSGTSTLSGIPDEELADALRSAQKAIYGTDDRLDVFQVTDGALLADAASTVALVRPGSLTDNGDGTSTLTGPTLGVARNLCATEPFRDQPAIAFCSGFLVAPDVVATAGHCLNAANLGNVRFVFGYEMTGASSAQTRIANSEIYQGSSVLGHSLGPGLADWALVRLDRTVPNHPPLAVRTSAKVPDTAPIHVIGHPSGLPKKIAGNANVRDNSPADHFVANLDTYGGNSGSAVFNSDTHLVEGILVRGETDYVTVGGCTRSVVCPDSGCRGEDVTRATEFAHLIPSGGGGTTAPPWPGRFLRFPPMTVGDDVRQWQERMTVIGFPLTADGKYGPNSKNACIALQTARSLQADGIVGPDTWRETFA